MGSPRFPSAAQLIELQTASELHTVPCVIHELVGGKAVVDVVMSPNSAVVLALEQ